MQIFILLGSFHGFFLSIAVFLKRKKSLSNLFLSIWIAVISYTLLITYMYLSGTIHSHILFFFCIEFSLYLSSVVSFLYISFLVDVNLIFKKRLIALFIPALLSFTFFVYYLFTNTPLGKIYYKYAFLSFIHAGIYFFLILTKLIRKRKAFHDWMLTCTRRIWIYSILILFCLTLAITLFIIILAIIADYNFLLRKHLHTLIAILVSLEIYLLGYFALTHPQLFIHEIDYYIKYPIKSIVADQDTEKEFEQIIQVLSIEKVYKRWDLTLEDLARISKISTPVRLSQIIKKHRRVNFATFINAYRLQEVKGLLLDHTKKSQSILELAFEAGFNSKATFNRVFKESIGLTPQEFRKQK